MTVYEPITPEPYSPPPAPVPPTEPNRQGFAIASLVVGIISLCLSFLWFCGGPTAIVGAVLGYLGLKSTGRGMAIAGIVLSALGLLLSIIFAVVFGSIMTQFDWNSFNWNQFNTP